MATKKRGRRAPAKKSRRTKPTMPKFRMPKFIQIAVATGPGTEASPEGVDAVYALDEVGVVWNYDRDEGEWIDLATSQESHPYDDEDN